MTPQTDLLWPEANQRYLMAALGEVREALERHAKLTGNESEITQNVSPAATSQADLSAEMPAPPALETLSALFGLSPFERQILLLCAGIELDGSFASLCAAAQGDPKRGHASFSLALAALPDAHWSALTPTAPLRYWQLIGVGAGSSLTTSPLRIDERILHYLAGVSHLDERLIGMVVPVWSTMALVPSHAELADRIALSWTATPGRTSLPAIQLCGPEAADKLEIAATACASLGLQLNRVQAASLPSNFTELETFVRLWEREAVLGASALLIELDDPSAQDMAVSNTLKLVERIRSAAIIISRDRLRSVQRHILAFDAEKPLRSEQHALWFATLDCDREDTEATIDELVAQFDLSAKAIKEAAENALGSGSPPGETNAGFWEACRIQTRPRLENLAQRITPAATWDDLVLPETQKQTLTEIAVHVHQRSRVYGAWGFAAKSSRGLGISALFEGASGTGKTMAAEVLANELKLDLYRIDLSSVVSKYIGETEKNLRQVFDAAETGGAILLFDEADALFGKRSEIKDSHDRYANIEISYLLQRMESYRGLAILTTNLKSALDNAFLRRIRFVVQFPFPDASYRAEIWKRVFPEETPTENLDIAKLARLNIAGGNIRNIALNAAFLAADTGEPVRMDHLLLSARSEYAKQEKTLSTAETGAWV